jgi:hypothetical protein
LREKLTADLEVLANRTLGFSKLAWAQGCQIFLGKANQNGEKCTNIATKKYQMAVKHPKILHPKAS